MGMKSQSSRSSRRGCVSIVFLSIELSVFKGCTVRGKPCVIYECHFLDFARVMISDSFLTSNFNSPNSDLLSYVNSML